LLFQGGRVSGDFSSGMKADEVATSAPGSSLAHLRVEDVAQATSPFKLWHFTSGV